MFDELYRKSGTIHVPTGEYDDGNPVFEPHQVTYFSMEGTFRDDTGTLQAETTYFCKGFEEPLPAGSKIVTEDGEEHDIAVSERIFDHFANGFECYKLRVVK